MDHKHIPFDIILQIVNQCPRALGAFVLSIHYADTFTRKAFFPRTLITEKHHHSWTKFKNDLRSLACIGLLEWTTKKTGISVEVYDFDTEV